MPEEDAPRIPPGTLCHLPITPRHVGSIPPRRLARSRERSTRRAPPDRDGPLPLLAADLTLRWEDEGRRLRRQMCPPRPSSSRLLSARVAKRESKPPLPAAASGCYRVRAPVTFGCLIHSEAWVKAGTYLAGAVLWHGVQRTDLIEVWFGETWRGIVHLGVRRERTACRQQMGAPGSVGRGDQVGEPQSVKSTTTGQRPLGEQR